MAVDWPELIRKNKPKVSQSTVKTYGSLINAMLKYMGVSDVKETYFETNYKDVLKHLEKNVTSARRKNCLSACMSVTKSPEILAKYRTVMISDLQAYEKEQSKQEMTKKQKDNWISWKEVMEVFAEKEKMVKPLWGKKKLTVGETQQLVEFVALACLVLIPPRRVTDWICFKLRNMDKTKDNYLLGRKMIFNTYKTAKSYGEQTVVIPERLRVIISRWAQINKGEYLLIGRKGEQLTQSKMTMMLNRVFGKKISVNMLRHIYISDNVLKDVPAMTKLQKTAEEMGHSLETQMTYKKIE